ncbi:hypothetical protein BDV93DRAFT_544238 [Ceratobasidium sp. AG-I]|nr:hypothetical protein BDV93DRAFT_544238 [Ceratobasidium sp. AG-I]
MNLVLARLPDEPHRDYLAHRASRFECSTMSTHFSPTQISMSNSHNRQTSVASFASSLYLPVDPENKPGFDDETEAYPSSDELFGVDHEEGDDYTISSRRRLSCLHSRYSSSAVSHPPTPPRSSVSLERSPSSLSLTPPRARHGNAGRGSSPLAPILATATVSTTIALPSPPSTARSSNDAHPMDAPKPEVDVGVPIEKFEQLVEEHLERDRTLLRTLRRLDDQKVRIAQLTYALSRLRVLSNSECLSMTDAPIERRSGQTIPVRRLGAVIPKPLIVQQSSKLASSSTFGRSAISATRNASGLSGPSQNEAINQRRQAKQQLHAFALRRPTRTAKGRPTGRSAIDSSASQTRRKDWEGTRGSASLVARQTKPRAPGVIDHPNITVRRPKRAEPPHPFANQSLRSPNPSAAPAINPATPPRLLSIFSSPGTVTSRSPQTPTQGRPSSFIDYDSPTTPVPNKRSKPLPARPISPTKPMRLARNMSFTYTIPPVPSPRHTTAHVTLVSDGERTPPLPVEEVQNRIAATFAHFSNKPRGASSQQQPSPPRRALDGSPPDLSSPIRPDENTEYLNQLLHQKWTAQLDEHSHQARGSWKSPLKNIRQKIAGGLGIGRRPSRASMSIEESEEGHMSLEGPGGYAGGLETVTEGDMDGVSVGRVSGGPPVVAGDLKGKKLKKKGSMTSEGSHQPPSSNSVPPSSTSTSTPAATPKPSKSTWRFSRLASSS